MKSLPIVNIANKGRILQLFCRDEQNNLIIDTDTSFFPYYYELGEGNFKSCDNKQLKRIFVTHPAEVKKQKSDKSYESDIHLSKRYLIDKIDQLKKCNFKYSFIDTEMLCNEFPNPEQAKFPISVISSHNSYTEKITSFYLGHYNKNEYNMLDDFVNYLKKESFDLLIFFNGNNFDMPYLLKKIKDFSKRISPVGQDRYGPNGMSYPCGTSIIDYMLIDKKFTLNRKKSYSLEARSKEVTGKSNKLEVNFNVLSEDLITHCENDVKDMIAMEKKLNYLPLIDSLRRLTKTEWEDCLFNSRYIDQLLLAEAKKKNVILPKKNTAEDNIDDFEGAFRSVYKTGRVFNAGSYDISGAYLNTIIELNLDPMNIRETKEENTIPINLTDRKTNELIKTYYVKQDNNALLPSLAKKLLIAKNKYKELKNNTSIDDENYNNVKEIYEAYKSISLSTWGVIGNKYFRYYDNVTSSLITSVPRDLLHYVKDNLEKKDIKLVFVDTDGMVVEDKGINIVDDINNLVKEWALNRFSKEVNLDFEYEGNYKSLFVMGNCHYKGRLETKKGIEIKVKGIEAKRKDSNPFIKNFQTTLLDKLLDNCKETDINNWILKQIKTFKEQSIKDIAFPCKLGRKICDYKTEVTNKLGKTYTKKPPIFVQALQNSKLKKRVGEQYYYIYCNKDTELIPVAFDNKNLELSYKIDYPKMIERNIILKVKHIFEAMDWDMGQIVPKKPSKTNKNKGTVDKQVPIKGKRRGRPKKSLIIENKKENVVKNTEMVDNKEVKENNGKLESYYEE